MSTIRREAGAGGIFAFVIFYEVYSLGLAF